MAPSSAELQTTTPRIAGPVGAGVVGRPLLSAVAGTWPLLFGMALLMLGNGLQASLLGIRASLEGFSMPVTGLVMSGYFAGFLAGCTLATRLVARVGHIRVFAALASLASVAIVIHALIVDPATWGAMRLVTGFCYAGLYVVAESWLNERSGNQMRGRLLSVYMLIVMFGMGGGQLLLNLADPRGIELFILVSILTSLALIPILVTVTHAPGFDAAAPVGLRQLYRISPLGVVGCVFVGLGNGALIGMGAVYAQAVALSVGETSYFMGAAIFGGLLFQWPIGRLSDRFDRRRVLTAVAVLAALFAVAAVPLSKASLTGLLALMVALGGLHLPLYSLCLAHANDYLEPRQMVAASSGLILTTGLGATFGPALAAGAMALWGADGFFWFLAAVHAGIGVFALHRMTCRAARPASQQGPHVPVPGTSRIAALSAIKTRIRLAAGR